MKVSDEGISWIISQLEEIKGLSGSQAAAVDEACDILYDYDAVCQDAARMAKRYEIPLAAVGKQEYGYCCPTCGRWIHAPDAWCHWCGQRIRWSSSVYRRHKQKREKRMVKDDRNVKV